MRSLGMMTAGVLVCGGALSAVQNAGQTPAIRSATAGVLIDVSVVDRKGQPVLDLSPHDFELKENGVRQPLTSARLVRTGPTSAQPLAPPVPVRPIASVATAALQPSTSDRNSLRKAVNFASTMATSYDDALPFGRQIGRLRDRGGTSGNGEETSSQQGRLHGVEIPT